MDQLDIAIIRALQIDARKPYTDIAKELDVAESTIRNRVSRLLADDTLRLRATFDYFKLGFNASAFIHITVQPGTDEDVADQLKQIPEVSYLMAVAGEADLLAELTCRNQAHLMDVVISQIRTIPGIIKTDTQMIMRVYKELLPSLDELEHSNR